MLQEALQWYFENRNKLAKVSVGEIDYSPPDGDDSFSFGFEASKNVYQIIVWNEGYIKFLSIDKNTMTQSVKDVKASNFSEMEKHLNDFLIEVLPPS